MTRTITLVGFAVLAASAVGLEILAHRAHRPIPFGVALGFALRRRWLRPTLLAGWLWLGWHVFVRVEW
ncbi:MAG: DUF6186 family protein [Acidimicrobiia bacterium]